jgi:DNA uptake protein ComE-like DNA-binding protein
MRRTVFLLTLALVAFTGCSTPEKRSPDAIRENTAKATAAATRDVKAVAKGVVEGLREKGPVNINRASADDLATLPGIDDATANKIIAGRPYQNSYDLVKRHLITKAEYDHIANRIAAK